MFHSDWSRLPDTIRRSGWLSSYSSISDLALNELIWRWLVLYLSVSDRINYLSLLSLSLSLSLSPTLRVYITCLNMSLFSAPYQRRWQPGEILKRPHLSPSQTQKAVKFSNSNYILIMKAVMLQHAWVGRRIILKQTGWLAGQFSVLS